MKKNAFSVIAAIVVVVLAVGYFVWGRDVSKVFNTSQVASSVSSSKSEDKSYIQIQTEVDVAGKKYDTYITENVKGLDLLKKIQKENTDFSFETKSSSFGEFITTMNKVKADETKEFWEIKINGKAAEVGISDLDIKSGDKLEFLLTKFN